MSHDGLSTLACSKNQARTTERLKRERAMSFLPLDEIHRYDTVKRDREHSAAQAMVDAAEMVARILDHHVTIFGKYCRNAGSLTQPLRDDAVLLRRRIDRIILELDSTMREFETAPKQEPVRLHLEAAE
jgi:hypothetical protein